MCVVDVADRASAYDMPGVVVDGNDVMAVYETASEAIGRARQGAGPSLIECKTYRHRGHFEGDPCVYRNEDELVEWKAKDPLPRFEKKLLEINALTQEKIGEIKNMVEKQLTEAVGFAEDSPFPDPSEVTDDVYTL
jgi:pyruvate dehydrogenase E1 component alpha subunit